jgi:hypothetical protein
MICDRFKKVILVAPDSFPDELPSNLKYVKHISNMRGVFPAIFEYKPEIVIIDCAFAANELEKVIRRIKFNKFYQNLKIYCYKNLANEKADSLLKAIGVDRIIYTGDLSAPEKSKSLFNQLNSVLDRSIFKWVGIANQVS